MGSYNYLELATLDHKSRRGGGRRESKQSPSIWRGEWECKFPTVEVASRSEETLSETPCSRTEVGFFINEVRLDENQCEFQFLM